MSSLAPLALVLALLPTGCSLSTDDPTPKEAQAAAYGFTETWERRSTMPATLAASGG